MTEHPIGTRVIIIPPARQDCCGLETTVIGPLGADADFPRCQEVELTPAIKAVTGWPVRAYSGPGALLPISPTDDQARRWAHERDSERVMEEQTQ